MNRKIVRYPKIVHRASLLLLLALCPVGAVLGNDAFFQTTAKNLADLQRASDQAHETYSANRTAENAKSLNEADKRLHDAKRKAKAAAREHPPITIDPPRGPYVINKRREFEEAIRKRQLFLKVPIQDLFKQFQLDLFFAMSERGGEQFQAVETIQHLRSLIKNYQEILKEIQIDLAAGADEKTINSLVERANQKVKEFNEDDEITKFNRIPVILRTQLLRLPRVPTLGRSPWHGLMDRVNGDRNKINVTVKSGSKQERKRGEKTSGKPHGNGCTSPCCRGGNDR